MRFMKSTKKGQKHSKSGRKKLLHFSGSMIVLVVYIYESGGESEKSSAYFIEMGATLLPKWRVKKWESFETAALREFREETGVHNSSIVTEIATVRDRIRRKKIVFFHMRHTESPPTTIRDEAVMWIELEGSPSQDETYEWKEIHRETSPEIIIYPFWALFQASWQSVIYRRLWW